jgi:WD40 repeat protein
MGTLQFKKKLAELHVRCLVQDTDPSLEQALDGHKRPVTTVTFNSSKKQIVSGSLDGTVLVHFQSPDHRPIRFNGHKVWS